MMHQNVENDQLDRSGSMDCMKIPFFGSGSLEQDSPLGIVAMKKEKQAGFMHDLGLGKG